MIKTVYIICEGPTESKFVKELLTPTYAERELMIIPIIIESSPGHRGGVNSHDKVVRELKRHCKSHSRDTITTMFDYYGYPVDLRNKADAKEDISSIAVEKMTAQLAADIGFNNFIPNFILHEFEALLFSDCHILSEFLGNLKASELDRAYMNICPEDINNSPATAPSKRLEKLCPRYEKITDGIIIAKEIGIDKMRARCPRFDKWLKALE